MNSIHSSLIKRSLFNNDPYTEFFFCTESLVPCMYRKVLAQGCLSSTPCTVFPARGSLYSIQPFNIVSVQLPPYNVICTVAPVQYYLYSSPYTYQFVLWSRTHRYRSLYSVSSTVISVQWSLCIDICTELSLQWFLYSCLFTDPIQWSPYKIHLYKSLCAKVPVQRPLRRLS